MLFYKDFGSQFYLQNEKGFLGVLFTYDGELFSNIAKHAAFSTRNILFRADFSEFGKILVVMLRISDISSTDISPTGS